MVSYFTVHGIDRSVLSFVKARRPDFFRLVLMGPFRIKYHRSAILLSVPRPVVVALPVAANNALNNEEVFFLLFFLFFFLYPRKN